MTTAQAVGAISDEAKEWYAAHGEPWVYAREAEAVAWSDAALRVNDASFESRVLRDQFETGGAHDAVLVAVSAGSQCEERARQLWQEGKPDEYFFLEMYGSAMVEHLIVRAGGRIAAAFSNERIASSKITSSVCASCPRRSWHFAWRSSMMPV